MSPEEANIHQEQKQRYTFEDAGRLMLLSEPDSLV